MILEWFWTIQIIMVEYQSLWAGPNHFGQVQIIKISLEKSNLDLTKDALDLTQMIWTYVKNDKVWDPRGICLIPEYVKLMALI